MRIFLFSFFISFGISAIASDESIFSTFDGYTLFGPNGGTKTYLLDMNGSVVHTWNHSNSGGYSVYLLENGNLLRPATVSRTTLQGGASSGWVQEINRQGNVIWQYAYNGSTYLMHHDIEPMPNGNALLIAWEVKTAAEASVAGRSTSAEIWPDHLVEVQPTGTYTGEIVWEWHVWDHLIQDYNSSKANYGIVADHPELFDINMGRRSTGKDWLHINAVSYNPALDQIVISSHNQNEIYVIDHSITTEEAAGHTGGNSGKGGDILYRWGNPSNYDAPGNQYFDVVHCSSWIPSGYPGAGNILAFNNGSNQRYSVVAEITLPIDDEGNYSLTPGEAYDPDQPTWTFSKGPTFYSNHLGGNQRLPNGNTIVVESTEGNIYEVTESGDIVWEYLYNREVARALRYPPDYPGLVGIVATPTPDSTASPSPTPTATKTEIPSTATPSYTLIPSQTPTVSASLTPAPTITSTQTQVPPTITQTHTPSLTPTLTPTSTLEATLTPSAIPTSTVDYDLDHNGEISAGDLYLLIEAINKKSGVDFNNDQQCDLKDLLLFSLQWGKTLNNNSLTIVLPGEVEMEMVQLKAGSFDMGAVIDPHWNDYYYAEQPVHEVTIEKGFYIGRFEVTQAQWKAVAGINPVTDLGYLPFGEGEDYPVYYISWDDCQQWIEFLNQLGLGTFRLPTEAEWEYACRAGNTGRFCFGDSDCDPSGCVSCQLDDYAWWCGNGTDFGAKPVGGKSPNDWGLYDMHGNIAEWCQDDWHNDYTNAPSDGSAWGDGSAEARVLRGGLHDDIATDCRAPSRTYRLPDSHTYYIGLRLVLEE